MELISDHLILRPKGLKGENTAIANPDGFRKETALKCLTWCRNRQPKPAGLSLSLSRPGPAKTLNHTRHSAHPGLETPRRPEIRRVRRVGGLAFEGIRLDLDKTGSPWITPNGEPRSPGDSPGPESPVDPKPDEARTRITWPVQRSTLRPSPKGEKPPSKRGIQELVSHEFGIQKCLFSHQFGDTGSTMVFPSTVPCTVGRRHLGVHRITGTPRCFLRWIWPLGCSAISLRPFKYERIAV